MLHQFIQKMRPSKRDGGVIVTSVAGLVGTPFFSCYSGSKSFWAILGAILWQELKGERIDVVTVVPGLTKNEFG
ncbi:MAG: SDR family NAD(P)-dependent oxidoreductase [Verrucomicrobia bacterium]|nr:SDR family NAD(P)-dependent oxidoreductase [Verrucomicrobiota bacterium]